MPAAVGAVYNCSPGSGAGSANGNVAVCDSDTAAAGSGEVPARGIGHCESPGEDARTCQKRHSDQDPAEYLQLDITTGRTARACLLFVAIRTRSVHITALRVRRAISRRAGHAVRPLEDSDLGSAEGPRASIGALLKAQRRESQGTLGWAVHPTGSSSTPPFGSAAMASASDRPPDCVGTDALQIGWGRHGWKSEVTVSAALRRKILKIAWKDS